jgi:hypothetical protein
MFLPMQEYFAGMDCPLVNASLVSWRDMFASDGIGSDVDAVVAASMLIDAGVVVGEDVQAESKDSSTSK